MRIYRKSPVTEKYRMMPSYLPIYFDMAVMLKIAQRKYQLKTLFMLNNSQQCRQTNGKKTFQWHLFSLSFSFFLPFKRKFKFLYAAAAKSLSTYESFNIYCPDFGVIIFLGCCLFKGIKNNNIVTTTTAKTLFFISLCMKCNI